MNTVDFSDMVGVFRDRTHADQAINELKQAGFQEDQIQLTEYNPHAEEDADVSPRLGAEKRFVMLVRAEGREQEAVGIMAQNSANNTDIPPGTKLVHGSIVGTDAIPVDLMPGTSETAS